MRPEEESKLQLRSEPATSELALEGCSYTSWLGSQGACSLHYGIRSEAPAHWVYVTEGALPEIVFRVDAAEARPSQAWFRLQEQVVERLGSIKAKGVAAGCLRLDGSKLAFFVEPDLVVDGALEVLFVADVEARALKTRESRKARAAELRSAGSFCLHAGDPAAIKPRS
jgi:hypothetical protein